MRSSQTEWNERVNIALELLREKGTTEEVVLALTEECGVSRRQSYRYIQEATKARRKLAVPEEKKVFTVKLPVSLIRCVRSYARTTGRSLSDIIRESIEKFLKRRRDG